MQSLQLGNVTFFHFEVPETLPNLFGEQKLAIHDMSGGTRIAQQLGAFPSETIEWEGSFFLGDAQTGLGIPIDRASLLNTYRVTGQPQMLTWGPFQYQVLVHKFEVIGRMQQWLQYKITLVPLIDYTTTSNLPPTAPSLTQNLFDANQGIINELAAQIAGLLTTVVTSSITLVTGALSLALVQGAPNGQVISSTNTTNIQALIAQAQLQLQPLINGTNYQQSAAAINLSAQLTSLSQLLSQGSAGQPITLTLTNPNLMALAAQYYGDASLWPLIAQANNLQDYLPIGTFQLTIPPESTQSQFIPPS